MAKGKKKKQEVKTQSLSEFLESRGEGQIPMFKEIVEGEKTKVINLSEVPLAPQASFEVIVRPHVLKAGPPYFLVARNFPFDCTEEQLKEFFENHPTTTEMQYAEGNRPKGIAIVGFETIEAYKGALEKDGMKIGPRLIHLTQGQTVLSFDDPYDKNRRKGERYQVNNAEFPKDFLVGDWRSSSGTTFVPPNMEDKWRSGPEDEQRRGGDHKKYGRSFNNDSGEGNLDLSCLRDPQRSLESAPSLQSDFNFRELRSKDQRGQDPGEFDLSVLRSAKKKPEDLPQNTPPFKNDRFMDKPRQNLPFLRDEPRITGQPSQTTSFTNKPYRQSRGESTFNRFESGSRSGTPKQGASSSPIVPIVPIQRSNLPSVQSPQQQTDVALK